MFYLWSRFSMATLIQAANIQDDQAERRFSQMQQGIAPACKSRYKDLVVDVPVCIAESLLCFVGCLNFRASLGWIAQVSSQRNRTWRKQDSIRFPERELVKQDLSSKKIIECKSGQHLKARGNPQVS